MKKYRVTKEHEWMKTGIELSENSLIPMFGPTGLCFAVKEIIKHYPTWFEEINSRWKPGKNELYWYVDGEGYIHRQSFDNNLVEDDRRFTYGNVFKTREEAEQAQDKVRSLLLSLH